MFFVVIVFGVVVEKIGVVCDFYNVVLLVMCEIIEWWNLIIGCEDVVFGDVLVVDFNVEKLYEVVSDCVDFIWCFDYFFIEFESIIFEVLKVLVCGDFERFG